MKEIYKMSTLYGKQEIYELLNSKGRVCKNLFLRDAKGKNHFLVTVPEEQRVDLKTLSNKLGSTKLSFCLG